MSSSECCKSGFEWQGTPSGSTTKIAGLDTYLSRGRHADRAILMIHDVFGWTLPNARLLADAYAAETGATTYLPDFYHGEVIAPDIMSDPKKREAVNLPAFFQKHSKDVRYPEIQAVVRQLRADGFKRIGAIGFCWGGWAVYRLAGEGDPSVDFISTAHPSLLTREEIEGLAIPTQILAPEHDAQFKAEWKALTKEVLTKKNLPHDYVDFPGLSHGFAVRGDPNDKAQREGLEKAMQDFINWSNKQFKL